MTKPNTFLSFMGLAAAGLGLLTLLIALPMALISSILLGLAGFFNVPTGFLTFFAAFGWIGVIVGIIATWYGLKSFNEHQTAFGHLLMGVYGVLFAIIGFAIAVVGTGITGGTASVVAIPIGIAFAVFGLALVDAGFKTKTIKPVSNILKKI